MINRDALRRHLRMMADMGKSQHDMALATGRSIDSVGRIIGPMGIKTRKSAAYQKEPAEVLEAVTQAGEEAARRGIPSEVCQYDHDEIALRCHWMAGYHDTMKEKQA